MSIPFLLFSLVLPVLFYSFSCGHSQLIGKRKYLDLLLTVIISNFFMFILGLVFRTKITQYELLLINAIFSILLSFIFLSVFTKKWITPVQILKAACFIASAVFVYSILTRGQVLIHGDTATASILTKCQMEYGEFFPDTWYYVNGDIWVVTIQNFTAPFVLLLKDQSLARALGSICFCLTAVFVIVYHSKKYFCADCWVFAVPLVFIFLTGQYDMILYQAAYTGQIIFLILACCLFFSARFDGKKPVRYIIFFAYILILNMGGIRYLAELIAPLLGACVIVRYFSIRNRKDISWKNEWKQILADLILDGFTILLPALFGIIIHRWLKSTHHLINSAHNQLIFDFSASEMVGNIFKYISNLFECFGFHGGISVFSLKGIMNMVSICLCVLIVFVIPALQIKKIKRETKYVQFFCAFSAVHNIIMFVLAACFAGKDESRYLLTSIFLCILISARYIYVYWISQNHFDKYIWTTLFVIAVFLGSVSLAVESIGWEKSLAYKEEVTDVLAERGLEKGYADFWTAYTHEVYSDFEIRYGGLEIYDGTPYAHFWLVDGNVFTPEDKPTFLMLTDAENQAVAPKISQIFEEPIEYFTINGYHIYVFDYDIVVDML